MCAFWSSKLVKLASYVPLAWQVTGPMPCVSCFVPNLIPLLILPRPILPLTLTLSSSFSSCDRFRSHSHRYSSFYSIWIYWYWPQSHYLLLLFPPLVMVLAAKVLSCRGVWGFWNIIWCSVYRRVLCPQCESKQTAHLSACLSEAPSWIATSAISFFFQGH